MIQYLLLWTWILSFFGVLTALQRLSKEKLLHGILIAAALIGMIALSRHLAEDRERLTLAVLVGAVASLLTLFVGFHPLAALNDVTSEERKRSVANALLFAGLVALSVLIVTCAAIFGGKWAM